MTPAFFHSCTNFVLSSGHSYLTLLLRCTLAVAIPCGHGTLLRRRNLEQDFLHVDTVVCWDMNVDRSTGLTRI